MASPQPDVISKRGKPKFTNNGYTYVFDKMSKDGSTKFWRCENKDSCPARVHTLNGEVVAQKNHHNHDTSAANVEAQKKVTEIKRRAATTMEATAVVIAECTQNMDLATAVALPKNDALKKQIRRIRNRVISAPANPENLEVLVIPESITQFKRADGTIENFLLADSGPGNQRILIFGLKTSITMMKEAKKWFVDGTFSIAPTIFAQVYTIMFERHGGVLPGIYALLPNKARNTYQRLYTMLLELEPDLAPEIINCDFEIAAFLPMQQCFPGVSVNGCFFHLCQNLRKKLAELKLIAQYDTNPEFALLARTISSLAFVPSDSLDDALEVLETSLPEDLKPVLNWLEDNYIGRPNRRGNGRSQPLFPVAMWNLYQRVLDGLDRTNNHAEAAHRRIQAQLQMDHPTIWKLIDGLKKVQSERNIFYERLVSGENPPAKKRKFIFNDECILKIVSTYNERNILEYLRGLAHRFELPP